ncbi:hypothetical protein N665_0005s0139 [Sinapis alba]|nr:hypothetical protein N665_0005s0139 [Sinapis alba]
MDLAGAHSPDLLVIKRSHGAPNRSVVLVLFAGDSRSFTSDRTSSRSDHTPSPHYLCSEDSHRNLPPHLLQSPPSSLVFGSLMSCVRGIPPLTRVSSSLQYAITISFMTIAFFHSHFWDSVEICGVSPTCSDEYLSPPSDVPCCSPSLSNSGDSSGDSSGLCSSPFKQDLVDKSGFKKSWACPTTYRVMRSMKTIVVDWICVVSLQIPDGFIGVYILQLLSYLSFMKILLVDSPCSLSVSSSSYVEESTVQPCLLPMKGDVSSDILPSFSFSLLTGLLSCVAVCTGPEDSIKITFVVLVGEGWLSTSHYVTILQLTDFVWKVHLTYSSFVLYLLSPSEEDLSVLSLSTIVLYVFFKRGCKIPSSIVSKQG